jgi:quercetin dioxygenase-like cupin family protein
MSDEMRLVALAGQPWEEVYPNVRRRIVGGERMTFTTYLFGPDGRFPKHGHPQEQIVMVLKGSITFTSPKQTVTLRPDHVLVIPSQIPHEAAAGTEGAVLVSVVAPARRSSTDYTIQE